MKPFYFFIFCVVFLLLPGFVSYGQDKPAYVLYNKTGKQVTFKDFIKAASGAEIVLFGEAHNNPISHWLQLQLIKELYAQKGKQLVLGAEMFEADDQLVINEYLDGTITDKHLETEAKIWTNYRTDYKPLLDYAKEKRLYFIATNIPRRYAALVSRQGMAALDSLQPAAKQWIAPPPVVVDMELPGYKKMIGMMGSSAHGHGMGAEHFVHAQAIKDATMAHFILQNKPAGGTFLHFNGSYHSNNYEGIYWYLRQHNKSLKIMTITTVEQENVSKLSQENQNLADFIICVPADMTKTY